MHPEQYDIVWFTPEHEQAALKYVRELDVLEIRARRLEHMRGLRVCPSGAPIPNANGVQNGIGACIFANYLGSEVFAPGATRVNSDGLPEVVLAMQCSSLHVIAPGLVGGILAVSVWDRPDYAIAAKTRAAMEQRTRDILDVQQRSWIERASWMPMRIARCLIIAPITGACSAIVLVIKVLVYVLFGAPAQALSILAENRRAAKRAAQMRGPWSPLQRANEAMIALRAPRREVRKRA